MTETWTPVLYTRTEYVDATTHSVVRWCRQWENEGWAIRQITLTKHKQHGWEIGRFWRWLLRLETWHSGFWMDDEIEAIVVLERMSEYGGTRTSNEEGFDAGS